MGGPVNLSNRSPHNLGKGILAELFGEIEDVEGRLYHLIVKGLLVRRHDVEGVITLKAAIHNAAPRNDLQSRMVTHLRLVEVVDVRALVLTPFFHEVVKRMLRLGLGKSPFLCHPS